MRNPFLLGLFDSLAHTDHRTAPVDVRTVLREHGGLQAFQPAERTSRLDLSAPIDRHRAAGGEVPLRPFRNERHFALLRVYSASFGKCSDILEVDDNACIVR